MPKFLRARPPLDDGESTKIRGLAGARHAPADWIERARIVALSWDGLGVAAIAAEAGCHPNKVRRWLHRFNAAGIGGLGDRPGAGRRRRITGAQRPAIIALARSAPPGRLARDADGELSADDESGPASRRAAARCGGSCWPRRCAGGGPVHGPPAPARSSPRKNHGRGAVHRPAAGLHGDLRRRAGAGEPAHLPARTRLVA